MSTLRGVEHAAILSAVREARRGDLLSSTRSPSSAEAEESPGQRLLRRMREAGADREAEALSVLSPGALDSVALGATPRLPQDLRD